MGVAVMMFSCDVRVVCARTQDGSVVVRNVSRMCSDARRECGRSKRKSYVLGRKTGCGLGRKTGVWSFET